jgi:hypothetical protein
MPKTLTFVLVAMLAFGLAACGQTEEPPPAEEPAPIEEAPPVDEVVEEPTAEVVEEVEEPVEVEEVDEFANLEILMPDGTTESVADMDMMDKFNLIRDEGFVARGDWDEDGDEDVAILLTNVIEEGNPVLFVAALENVDGTLQSAGTYTADPNSDVQDIRIEGGQLLIDVIRPTEDGAGYEVVTVAFTPVSGSIGEPQPSDPAPAPTAPPASDPPPAAPKVTFSVKPSPATQPEGIDIHTHAFENPAIVRLELHRNGQLWMEWNSDTEEGVPYIHHTFKWVTSTPGSYEVQVIAKDKWGGEGRTEVKKMKVNPKE